ncbi:MAG: helix-turn-helix domain-containing protein [Solirubrobacteraceae bacterium]
MVVFGARRFLWPKAVTLGAYAGGEQGVGGGWVADTVGFMRRPLLRKTLGEVLRRIRLAQGRTLAEVAQTAKISMPYLSELERGRKEASSEVLAAICEALQIELAEVLAEVMRTLLDERAAAAVAAAQRPMVIRLDSVRMRPTTVVPQRPARPSGDLLALAA